jgi:hypothetical protein
VGDKQSFPQAFDSYGNSVASILILHIRGSQAGNLTRKAPFLDAVRGNLEHLEKVLAEEPGLSPRRGR